jgi:hypothetical protein
MSPDLTGEYALVPSSRKKPILNRKKRLSGALMF